MTNVINDLDLMALEVKYNARLTKEYAESYIEMKKAQHTAKRYARRYVDSDSASDPMAKPLARLALSNLESKQVRFEMAKSMLTA